MKIVDSTPNEFRSFIKNRKTICFGGGDYFRLFFFDFGTEACITGIIDNDKNKQGINMLVADSVFRIYSLDEAICTFDLSSVVFVVTASAYKEIISQLQSISELDNVICFVYAQIKYSVKNTVNAMAPISGAVKIPPVIHYCWFGGKQLPENLLSCIESWRRLCPDYEIIEWNESNYDVNKCKWTRNAYRNKLWPYLTDYARIDIIAELGGIYLDTDVELLKNLDEMRRLKGFIATEAHGGINTGSGFGAVAHLRIFNELLERFNYEFESDVQFCRNVGRETEVFWRHGYKLNGQLQVIEDVAVLPYNVLTPIISDTGECNITDATAGVHYFNRAWKG